MLVMGGQQQCRGDEGGWFLQAWGQTVPGKRETCSDRNRNSRSVTQPHLWPTAACPLLNPVLLPLPVQTGGWTPSGDE